MFLEQNRSSRNHARRTRRNSYPPLKRRRLRAVRAVSDHGGASRRWLSLWPLGAFVIPAFYGGHEYADRHLDRHEVFVYLGAVAPSQPRWQALERQMNAEHGMVLSVCLQA